MKFNKFDKILLIMCLAYTIILWWNYNKPNQKLDSIKMESKLMVQIPKFRYLSESVNTSSVKETIAPFSENNNIALSQNYQYEISLEDGTIRLLSYIGDESIVFVPETINGRTVCIIGEKCFYNNNYIEQVILPVGITVIEREAFSLCTKLEYIIMEEGIEDIKFNAVSDCPNLKELHLPEGLTRIENICTNCQRLEKVYIPQSAEYISEEAFTGCTNLKLFYGSTQYAQIYAQQKDKAYVDLNRIQKEGNVVW